MASNGECASSFLTAGGMDLNVCLSPVVYLSGLCVVLFLIVASRWNPIYQLRLIIEFLFFTVPTIDVKTTAAETDDDGVEGKPSDNTDLKDPKRPGLIQCFDPSTKQRLGEVKAMTASDVQQLCSKAAVAQEKWATTSFAQRRMVLRTIQKYIVTHIEDICRVCTRDSGKPKVDALLGEVMTTCEKIRTINAHGELWLRPSYRPTGPMMMHKDAYVEYVPLGVLGVIAPWNYPVSTAEPKTTLFASNHKCNSPPCPSSTTC